MKKMKRIIAAILALTIMLSLSATGIAYYTGPAAEEAYSEKYIMALNTLYGLGVLPDNSPDKYEQNVTRAEFAQYAGALLGGRTIENVPQPAEQIITLGEAVQMLVDGTENTIRAEKYGYISIAGQMGITHGLARMQSYDQLTYGAVVQILYNSMRITPGDMASISTEGVDYEFDESRTVLTEYLDIEYKNGFMTADGFWSLNPTSVLDENSVVINGKTFTVRYPGLDDYVGYYVNYYYSSSRDMILAIEKSASAKQVILNSADITDYSNNTYTQYVNGNKTRYKVSSEAYIISNFVPAMDANVDMIPQNADIVLVDADGNNTYETVFIKTYTEIKVSSINVEDEVIAGKGAGSYKLSEDLPARVYLNGQKVDYTKVQAESHASLVVDADGIVREIYLSSKKITGTVSALESDSNKIVITVNGTDYTVAGNIENINKLKLGMSAEFALNFKGEIAYFEITAGGEGESFGYIIVAADIKGGVSGSQQMKLMLPDGTYPVYEIADKCKVNGEVPEEDIIEMFTETVDDELRTKQQLIYFATNSQGKINKITIPLENSDTMGYSDYELHVSVDASESSLQYAHGSFHDKSVKSDDTAMFSVPTTYTEEENQFIIREPDSQQYHNFRVYNFEKYDSVADAVVVYRTTAGSRDGVCGGAGPAIDYDTAPMCVVKTSKMGYVEEYGDYYPLIEFLNLRTGAIEKKILADNASWMAWDANRSGEVISYTEGRGSMDLLPGDLFQYSLNLKDEIGTVHKAYDASDNTLVAGTRDTNGHTNFDFNITTNFGSFYSSFRVIQGYPVAADNDTLTITRSAPNDISNLSRSEVEFFKNEARATVYFVKLDGNNTEITKKTMGEIVPSTDINEKAFVFTSWATLQNIVVYEAD